MYLYTLILLSHSPLTPYWQLHSYVLVDPEVSFLLSCLTSILFFPMLCLRSLLIRILTQPCPVTQIPSWYIRPSSITRLFWFDLVTFLPPSSLILNCLFPLIPHPSLRSFINQFSPHLLLHNFSFVCPLSGSYAHISSTFNSCALICPRSPLPFSSFGFSDFCHAVEAPWCSVETPRSPCHRYLHEKLK